MTEPHAEELLEVIVELDAAEVERPHTLTGDIRTHEDFHSRYLEKDRTVLVYLPPDYDPATADRYPVSTFTMGRTSSTRRHRSATSGASTRPRRS
jgi:hypothetical protein